MVRKELKDLVTVSPTITEVSLELKSKVESLGFRREVTAGRKLSAYPEGPSRFY